MIGLSVEHGDGDHHELGKGCSPSSWGLMPVMD